MKANVLLLSSSVLLFVSASAAQAQYTTDNPGIRSIGGPAPDSPARDSAFPMLQELFGNDPSNESGINVWARAEFLSWWFKGSSSPPLVTTGPSDTLPTLGKSTTQVLFGDHIPGDNHLGGRFTLGLGLPGCDPCQAGPADGIELSYFFVDPRGPNYVAGSPGTPIISRPFYDISSGTPISSVEGVANPAGLGLAPVSGTVSISDPTRIYGFELNGLHNLCCDPCRGVRVDLIYGFRELSFDEDLRITENLALTDGSGEKIIVHDNFSTRNQFFGGQVGIRGEKTWGYFFINGTAKVALGEMHSEAMISGTTTDSLPGFPTITAPGGLLAQASNSGYHARYSFCVLPESQINLGANLTQWLRLYAGYDFLYISQVARPGNQIDLTVNSNQVPSFAGGTLLPTTPGGPARPAFHMNRTDFWAQGITAGIEVIW